MSKSPAVPVKADPKAIAARLAPALDQQRMRRARVQAAQGAKWRKEHVLFDYFVV